MNLLFHQAALGDFVLTLPLLRGLGATTVVAPWSKAALAARVAPNTRAMDIEMWEFTRLWSERGPTSLSPAMRELFENAARLVSFVSAGDDAWAGHVRRLAPRAAVAFVPPRPPGDWEGHVTAWHLASLRGQGIDVTPQPPPPRRNPTGPVVVHAGSGGRDKCWPAERFETLVARLRDAGRSVTPLLGEAEAERWPAPLLDRWRADLGARVLRSLDDLHDTLAAASLYVGNDAGPTHLAAQLGIPTLALFGPSNPARWAPQGPVVRVLAPPRPAPMDWLAVDDALAAAQALA